MLRVGLVRVADHAEHGLRLRHAVNRELRVEDFVTAMLTVGLCKHHQLDIGRVAPELREGLHQVVDLVSRQCQSKLGVGSFQRGFATVQDIHMGHRRRLQFSEQAARTGAVIHHTLGHAVMQQSADCRQLRL